MQEENKQNIQIGDKVMVTYAWDATERPTDANFFFGFVTEVFYKPLGDVELLKFRVEGIDYPVASDRVVLIEKSQEALQNFVPVRQAECANLFRLAYQKGYHGKVISFNHDRTKFEVESDTNIYNVAFHYSDITETVFASCDCLHFLNRKKACKHIATIGRERVFAEAMAA